MKDKKILSNKEIASFCSQLSLIYNAGITPAEGMHILLSDTQNTEGREIIETILHHCNQGEPFHTAIASAGVFPDYVVNMITIGEESGNLDDVLKSLTDYYEREQSISESIRSAVTYPIVMIGMMVLVITVLLTRVLPIFNQVFVQLGSEMQGISKTLMNLGNSLRKYSIVIIAILAFLAICFILLNKTHIGNRIKNKFLNSFFITRNFYESIAAGRFASGMSLMLGSGMDTYGSLDLVSVLVNNKHMEEKIKNCKKLVESGKNFSEAIAETHIFSNLYAKMISVGFRAGSIDTEMKKIADKYEKETDKKIRNIISIIEPTLVIILSVIVGLILLSVILPLMGIMSSIG